MHTIWLSTNFFCFRYINFLGCHKYLPGYQKGRSIALIVVKDSTLRGAFDDAWVKKRKTESRTPAHLIWLCRLLISLPVPAISWVNSSSVFSLTSSGNWIFVAWRINIITWYKLQDTAHDGYNNNEEAHQHRVSNATISAGLRESSVTNAPVKTMQDLNTSKQIWPTDFRELCKLNILCWFLH